MKRKRLIKTTLCLALIVCICAATIYIIPKQPTPESKIAYIHISFDDVTYCLDNLTNNEYESVFDEPFFAWLKHLHNTYDAKFSLYTYLNVIESVPNTYALELSQSSDWIKFGLHAPASGQTFIDSDYIKGKLAWETFVHHIIRITGTPNSVDRFPRLHYYAGNTECLNGMKDAQHGALGFLSADDDRISYNFTKETSDYLFTHDYYTDITTDLVFLSTDLRTDWFSTDFTTNNVYRTPTESTVYDELESRYNSENYTDALYSYIVFGHEWKIYNGTHLSDDGKTWFEDILLFSKNYHIEIDYPQNRLSQYA